MRFHTIIILIFQVTKHIHCPTDPTCLNPMKQITISKSYLLGP